MLRFRLHRKRVALLHIAEVEGRAGIWPMRRSVRFSVGRNCDAIRVEGRCLVVFQHGKAIAKARNRPV
jgi:hypothetical protein